MVRIMALKNREQEDMSQTILIETVRVVRDFLNGELAKVDEIEYLNESIKVLFQGIKEDFQNKKSFRKP
jgi:hypothetical protein